MCNCVYVKYVHLLHKQYQQYTILLTFSIDLGPRHVRIMSEIACKHGTSVSKFIRYLKCTDVNYDKHFAIF